MKESVKQSIFTTEAVVSAAMRQSYGYVGDAGRPPILIRFDAAEFDRRIARGRSIMAIANIAWDHDAATSKAISTIVNREDTGDGCVESIADDGIRHILSVLAAQA
jgi:hypothetical protein